MNKQKNVNTRNYTNPIYKILLIYSLPNIIISPGICGFCVHCSFWRFFFTAESPSDANPHYYHWTVGTGWLIAPP